MRHAVEYLLARGTLAVVDRLSPAAACRLGTALADLWFRLDRRRRRVAVDNLLASGIVGDRRRARRLARLSARHFATVVVESLKSRQLFAGEAWRERVEIDIAPDVLAVLRDPGQGLLVASAHFGNWEVAAHLLSLFKPVVGAARKTSNPRVERLLWQRKPSFAFRLIEEWGGQPRRFLEVLRRGEALALLVDLDARGRGIAVDFFGRPAATHTTLPMLHLVTGAPMVFGYCLRTGPGRFVLRSSGLMRHRPSGDRQADCRAILDLLHRELEAAIRAAPEQYVWAHSRWKHGHWRPGLPGVRRGESLPAPPEAAERSRA